MLRSLAKTITTMVGWPVVPFPPAADFIFNVISKCVLRLKDSVTNYMIFFYCYNLGVYNTDYHLHKDAIFLEQW